MAEEKSCFIIMPITTPDSFAEKYRDGKDHFKHVLECLFIPSVKKAGLKPIPPIAKGSDLIHAEIIKCLETSNLVLCDMSTLNPNVFFEYGIRTSLNKPVCVVKDELTTKVPFDTGILNNQEYKSSIEPWDLNKEIDQLAEHLKSSMERSNGENTLWKYFGLKTTAKTFDGEVGIEMKLDFISSKIDAIKANIDSKNIDGGYFDNTEQSNRIGGNSGSDKKFNSQSTIRNEVISIINTIKPKFAVIDKIRFPNNSNVIVTYKGEYSDEQIKLIADILLNTFDIYPMFEKIEYKKK